MPSSGVQTCARSEEHTSELQSHDNLVCRLLLEKKKHNNDDNRTRTAPELPVLGHPRALPGPQGEFSSASRCLRGAPVFWTPCSRVFFFMERAPPDIPPFSLPWPFPS